MGRSTTDQTLRLSQFVFHGFQAKEKTAVCLFDYSMADGTVWRNGLLRKMQKLGVLHPKCFRIENNRTSTYAYD